MQQFSQNSRLNHSILTMIYDFLGLLWEFVLLGIAAYGYAFSRGFVVSKDATQRKKMEAFRQENQWLLYVSILLGAIMIINLYIRFTGF